MVIGRRAFGCLLGCWLFWSATPSLANHSITFKSFGNAALCRAMIVDSTKVDISPWDAISHPRNSPIPDDGVIVSMFNVGHDLEADARPMMSTSKEWKNGHVAVSHFDLLNSGTAQNVYHIYSSSHYFDGDIFIATDAAVSEETVAVVIDGLISPSGDLEHVRDVAASHGWIAFTGAETFYRRPRYTTLAAFSFKGKTYLAATGLRPGPIAIVLEPLPNGRMKNACFFYLKL